ncbi:MAG TPA: hypothetical protein VMW23_04320 [Sedimentisphaerales bacterium]|nr:hypothetical protein [Sedimentisphaerales bacterium]
MTTATAVEVPVNRFVDNMVAWQYDLYAAFDEGLGRFFMCECHRRSRKTTAAVNLLIRECCTHSNCSYFYMGPTFAQAKDIVWLDPNMLFSYLPDKNEFPWEKNEAEMYIRFHNNSMLHILGGDKPDRLRGIDATGGVLDEWALMKEVIFTEILRPIMMTDLERWLLFLYTPKGSNHATNMFDKGGCIKSASDLPVNGPCLEHIENWHCIRVIADKSGILSPDEIKQAQKDMPTAIYEQELQCARVTDEERALITSRLLDSLHNVVKIPIEIRKIISCDPAEGNDEIAVKVFENTDVIHQRNLHRSDIADNLMILSGTLQNIGIEYHTDNFIIDSIGVGKGVADDLLLKKDKDGRVMYDVQVFKGNNVSTEPERFADLNTESLWYTAQQMKNGSVEPVDDPETKRQLVALTCQANRRGQLQLDTKDVVKKSLKCSPDRAKCYLMGIWGLQNVHPEADKGRDRVRASKRRRRRCGSVSPMGI